MRNRLSLLVSFLALLICFLSTSLAAEPEEVWRNLSKSSGQERQKLLLSKARAEGEILWYTTLSADLLEPLREDFERRYPGAQARFWRGRGETVANRVLTEARAGTFNVDVVSGSNENVTVLKKADLVGRYGSPERRFYSNAHKDREEYWTSLINLLAIMAYNTRLVPKAEAVKRYEDFLDPKWKGNFAIDSTPDRALMGWLKVWGDDKTEKFLQGIMKNGAAVHSGHDLIAQLLCAGEFKAAIELYSFRLADLKQKGCPIEMVFPNPAPGAVTPLYVAKRSARPYGGALLVDYLLSEPGQQILVQRGFYSGRQGVKPPNPELDLEAKGVNNLLLNPDDVEKLGKRYFELRERYLLKR